MAEKNTKRNKEESNEEHDELVDAQELFDSLLED